MQKQDNLTFEVHLRVDHCDQMPVDLLTEHTTLSRALVKQAMLKGAVWLTRNGHTQRLRRVKKALLPGDEIHCYYNESVLRQATSDAILISDEGQYSVWYKPSGMLSQGSKWSDHTTVVRWAESHLSPQRVAFPLHRLDRATKGLILVGHSKSVTRHFSALFKERKVKKKYQALVEGNFFDEKATFETPISGKSAKTTVKKVQFNTNLNRSLLDIGIDTGRKHQIRIHLANAGFPIIGDRLHGHAIYTDVDLQLIAYSLSFTCPLSSEHKQFYLPNHLMLSDE